MSRESRDRLEELRKLLVTGESSTQEELREVLEKMDLVVTQSTISRDLKKLGAMRAIDSRGQTVYRLPNEVEALPSGNFGSLVLEVLTNGSLIVIRTAVGSASLVARHLDRARPGNILGTIAGDDTIFVAPASTSPRDLAATLRALKVSLLMNN